MKYAHSKSRQAFLAALTCVGAVLVAMPASAQLGQLQAVQYPEDRDTEVRFASGQATVAGKLKGDVDAHEGQSKIKLHAHDVPPAISLGGDINTYVIWAMSRDGRAENLGELYIRDAQEQVKLSTGLKEFALIVTAEVHPLVERPSELVVFYNLPSKTSKAPSTAFAFDAWAPAPELGAQRIVLPDSDAEIDVLQARRIVEMAATQDADRYAPEMVRDAQVALAQAENFWRASKQQRAVDYARRATNLGSQALRERDRAILANRIAAHEQAEERHKQALSDRAESAEARALSAESTAAVATSENAALAQELAERERQLTEQTRQATELERTITEREAALALLASRTETTDAERRQAEAALADARNDLVVLERDRAAARHEAARLRAERTELAATVGTLVAEQDRLEQQKAAMAARLEASLSEIASTRSTVRGLVVSLPDILFDVDKATLKPDAQVTLARIAGVLSAVPELELEIEGHTDATGTDRHNLELSKRRAESVTAFLISQGIEREQVNATRAFGESQPIASNDTSQGRQLNRRVEVVIDRESMNAAAIAD